jgi:hypothetical protein
MLERVRKLKRIAGVVEHCEQATVAWNAASTASVPALSAKSSRRIL